MSSALVPILATLLAGIGVASQSPANATLARASGSLILSSLVSFAVGTLVLLGLWLAADRTSPATLKGVPAYAWLGGVYGAYFISAATFAVPRLGLAAMLTLMIASQLIAALVFDHFGFFGLQRVSISVQRVAGVLLVLGGVLLVRRG